MGDKLFALNVKRLFGFAQALVYLYDMLRNLSKLIVREGGLYVHVYGFVLVGPLANSRRWLMALPSLEVNL